jgi:L-2-hydroxyglutarate oxidase
MEAYDVVVVGAGLVGLATARALVLLGVRSVCVLEAEGRVAAHQSGHNSGVIHSGLYYRPGTLKARLCVEGRAALLRYCEERGVRYEQCGKLVVATDACELARLEELERRGRENGLAGLRRLGPDALRAREPHAAGIAALLVPQTGIIDFAAVARALAQELEERGVELRLGTGARAFERLERGYAIETARATLRARVLVSCAGARADEVARRAGIDPEIRIVPFRGEYLRLAPERRELVRHLIYPVPDPELPFLGVHFTRTLAGEVEVGPNAVLALHRDGYRRRDVSLAEIAGMLAYRGFRRMAWTHARAGTGELLRSLSRAATARALRRLVPDVRAADLLPSRSGVRAQAVDRNGMLLDEFRIVEAQGALHVVNAPSPAATACLAIGEHVAERLRARLWE